MRSLAVVAAAGLVLMSLACGGGVGEKELIEFRDNPERFKGKEVKAVVTVWMPASSGGGRSLRDHAGKPYRFCQYLNGGRIEMTATLPSDAAAMPDAVGGDVLLTFVCEQGKHNEGNRAVSVKRP